jgi:hypothetical protein
MTSSEYLIQRARYTTAANASSVPGVVIRLRTLASQCLLLADQPDDEKLRKRYIDNCREFEAFMAAGNGVAIDPKEALQKIRT